MVKNSQTMVNHIEQWCAVQLLRTQNTTIKNKLIPLSGDASNRRYFRLYSQTNKSYILAHSPPETEKNQSFYLIAKNWLKNGIRTPVVFAADINQGFFLIEDLGVNTLLDVLQKKPENTDHYYQLAMSTLHRIQTINTPKNIIIPNFDANFIRKEIQLFEHWVLVKLLKQQLTIEQKKIINIIMDLLTKNAISQPYLLMHRDFHSKNIIQCSHNQLGILDFQDAVIGPVTYDIVSLLRDCYIDHSSKKVYQWLANFKTFTPILHSISNQELQRWFDWMGLQRHLKVAGIFIRQWLKQNNSFYLQYIPRIFAYIQYICIKYYEFKQLSIWLEAEIIPMLTQQSWWQPHQLSQYATDKS